MLSDKLFLVSNALSIGFFAYLIVSVYFRLLPLSVPVVVIMTFTTITIRFIARLIKVREGYPEMVEKFSKKKKK